MSKVPRVLSEVAPLMKRNIIEDFDIPEGNMQMAKRIQEYLDRGGKYVRPAIVYSTVKSYTPERINDFLWPALSLQYDHNFFLIHDDFEDGSFFRRGKFTMHLLYGDDFAINYGDYLRTLAELAMDKSIETLGKDKYIKLVRARHEMLKITAEGQDLELLLRSLPLSEMTEEKIFEILEKKTPFYTLFTPYRYGGIISDLPDVDINSLKCHLISLGVSFQIRDDVLDLIKPKEEETGKATLEEQRFGKDWLGDLEEIKRTLPLVKVVNYANPTDKKYLFEMLDFDGKMVKLVKQRNELRLQRFGKDDNRYKKIQDEIDSIKVRVVELMHKYNAIEESQSVAYELYQNNINYIKDALPTSEGKEELLELFHFLVHREF